MKLRQLTNRYLQINKIVRWVLGIIVFLVVTVKFPYQLTFQVCEHQNNADATIIQVTDQYYPLNWKRFQNDSRKYSSSWAEFLAFQYNIPVHVFEQNIKGNSFKEFLKTGRGGASVYFPSCHKKYSNTTLDSIINIIAKAYNRIPTTIAYGCGKKEYIDKLPNYILGGRNSSFTSWNSNKNAITWYGKNCGESQHIDFSDRSNILSRPSGGRYYTDIQIINASTLEASNFVRKQVERTIATSGFYVNFMHWQDFYKNSEGVTVEGVPLLKNLFEVLSNGVGTARIAQGDYNDAIEYLYVKEAVKNATLKSDNNKTELIININAKQKIDYTVINTPVTLKLSKEKITIFGYSSISKNTQIISLYQDTKNLYLNVRLDFTKKQNIIPISFSKNNNIPFLGNIPKLKYNTNRKKITSSNLVKFIVFKRCKGSKEYEVEVIDRTITYSKSHILKEFDIEYEYYCGAINKQGESSLITLN